MAAKRHFGSRREPAQTIVITFVDQESRLAQVVLSSNFLKRGVFGKLFHYYYRSGVSFESVSSESVNMEYRQAHL